MGVGQQRLDPVAVVRSPQLLKQAGRLLPLPGLRMEAGLEQRLQRQVHRVAAGLPLVAGGLDAGDRPVALGWSRPHR
jgi:hypothetical protein